MSSFMDNIKTVNSLVRTVIAGTVLGGVGFGGWFGYHQYIKPGIDAKNAQADLEQLKNEFDRQKSAFTSLQNDFDQQAVKLEKAEQENQQLQTSLKLLKIDHRMAHVEILKKSKNKEGQPELKVRFTEFDPSGNVIGVAREFTLKGEQFYVDNWIVSFEDKYVEAADLLRSCSLCIFKSIYGELDGPAGAQSLDRQSGTPPGIYRLAGQNEFEQQIWSDFWNVCNDVERQEELGIRAIHGQANYIRAREGQVYQVELRASGGTSIRPVRN